MEFGFLMFFFHLNIECRSDYNNYDVPLKTFLLWLSSFSYNMFVFYCKTEHVRARLALNRPGQPASSVPQVLVVTKKRSKPCCCSALLLFVLFSTEQGCFQAAFEDHLRGNRISAAGKQAYCVVLDQGVKRQNFRGESQVLRSAPLF